MTLTLNLKSKMENRQRVAMKRRRGVREEIAMTVEARMICQTKKSDLTKPLTEMIFKRHNL